MPTVELHGFDPDTAAETVARVRGLIGGVPYRANISFEFPRSASRVETWDGTSRPFIRICARTQEKVDELAALLVPVCDIQTLVMGYHDSVEEVRP